MATVNVHCGTCIAEVADVMNQVPRGGVSSQVQEHNEKCRSYLRNRIDCNDMAKAAWTRLIESTATNSNPVPGKPLPANHSSAWKQDFELEFDKPDNFVVVSRVFYSVDMKKHEQVAKNCANLPNHVNDYIELSKVLRVVMKDAIDSKVKLFFEEKLMEKGLAWGENGKLIQNKTELQKVWRKTIPTEEKVEALFYLLYTIFKEKQEQVIWSISFQVMYEHGLWFSSDDSLSNRLVQGGTLKKTSVSTHTRERIRDIIRNSFSRKENSLHGVRLKLSVSAEEAREGKKPTKRIRGKGPEDFDWKVNVGGWMEAKHIQFLKSLGRHVKGDGRQSQIFTAEKSDCQSKISSLLKAAEEVNDSVDEVQPLPLSQNSKQQNQSYHSRQQIQILDTIDYPVDKQPQAVAALPEMPSDFFQLSAGDKQKRDAATTAQVMSTLNILLHYHNPVKPNTHIFLSLQESFPRKQARVECSPAGGVSLFGGHFDFQMVDGDSDDLSSFGPLTIGEDQPDGCTKRKTPASSDDQPQGSTSYKAPTSGANVNSAAEMTQESQWLLGLSDGTFKQTAQKNVPKASSPKSLKVAARKEQNIGSSHDNRFQKMLQLAGRKDNAFIEAITDNAKEELASKKQVELEKKLKGTAANAKKKVCYINCLQFDVTLSNI